MGFFKRKKKMVAASNNSYFAHFWNTSCFWRWKCLGPVYLHNLLTIFYGAKKESGNMPGYSHRSVSNISDKRLGITINSCCNNWIGRNIFKQSGILDNMALV